MYKQSYILLFIYSQKDMEIQSNWNNLVPQPYTNWKRHFLLLVISSSFKAELSYRGKENESFWLSQFYQSAKVKPFCQPACPFLQALLFAKEKREKKPRGLCPLIKHSPALQAGKPGGGSLHHWPQARHLSCLQWDLRLPARSTAPQETSCTRRTEAISSSGTPRQQTIPVTTWHWGQHLSIEF